MAPGAVDGFCGLGVCGSEELNKSLYRMCQREGSGCLGISGRPRFLDKSVGVGRRPKRR